MKDDEQQIICQGNDWVKFIKVFVIAFTANQILKPFLFLIFIMFFMLRFLPLLRFCGAFPVLGAKVMPFSLA